MRPRGSAKELEARRLEAMRLLDEGISQAQVARRLGVTRNSVWRWKEAYRNGGKEALRAKPSPGRRCKLSPEQKENLAERLVQGARLRAHLVFLDETGFLMLPLVQRTWAQRGVTPFLRHRLCHHRKVSAIGALTISPKRRRLGLYLHLYPQHNICQEAVIVFLPDLRRHLGGPIVVIWDRWSVHRGGRVRRFLEGQSLIHAEWLPPCAPDLNPMDKGWGWMKCHRLANYAPAHLDDLSSAVASAHQEARARQDLLRSFVRATGLPIRL